ncbi:hypothetical protein [Dysgonomonas sp. GY617]|uniref:hypothetical protein n=1 Tax=Dysgonomonas sp. GY617 TaxID=2780420 RepID=UPI0018848182|nr:hypothetical protein [Dysgonomonas sp. GY617]MBF0575503.1 hypothetical protein [Dysgonomonas sp. GY617]
MGRRRYNLVVKSVFCLLIVCAFYRCTPTPPRFEEMIGTWRAEDGAIIELKSDSTFVIEGFDSYFFHKLSNDTIRYRVYAQGEWEVEGVYLGNIILSIGIDCAIRSSDFLFISDKKNG